MRVLVIGSNGFIGSKLVHRLNVGHTEVIAGLRPGGGRVCRSGRDSTKMVECDITDLSSLTEALRESSPDIVVHLATKYAVQHQPQEASSIYMTNVIGTINLLEAIRAQGDIGLINTSSCFVYASKSLPLVETDPLDPYNLYALTKLQAEEACRFYIDHHGLRIINVRLFPPYGPGDNERKMIPTFIRAILSGEAPRMTDGLQEWDYIHVDDVVDAYKEMIAHFEGLTSPGLETYNIGTGRAISVRSIGETILELMHSNIRPLWGALPLRSRELSYLCSNIDKVRSKLDWAPRVSIPEGLGSVIRYYEEGCTGEDIYG